ncbi:MAG TPA: sigma factor-like helix-turn-helix DNA-binding protein, partial [Usitatibacteraceae bacterium]|nr:sigma factor-like helix-turn-helix DNA-binding protein [Usitatibacteraceae bacterium]
AQLSNREAMARFAVAFGKLPPAQREAFVMKEEAEMSIAEIAAATGSNEEAVKSRVRYATAKLREALDG